MNRQAIWIASRATKSSACCRRSIASTARPSSWSPTIRTLRRGPAGRSIWTRASFPQRSRNEIPFPGLEQPEAPQTAHLADPVVGAGGLCPLRHLVRAEGGVYRRSEYGGRQSPDRAPPGVVHPDAAVFLPATHRASSRSDARLVPGLVRRRLSGSEKPVRKLSGRTGSLSPDESG